MTLRGVQRAGQATLARIDARVNALYGWRYNPLYHSGALAVASFVVLLLSGLYLFLFYRIGAPYASVARITDQAFAGRWIRSLHRYASDLAVVAIAFHALRMFVQDRSWGPRTLAWLSGCALTVVFLICGWTGYVMVWDVQAQAFAVEGARLFDFLPIFSEPISRTFSGERAIPSAFFFLNLFAHIALPVGIALLLWIHLSRLARAKMMPPRPLQWATLGVFVVLSVVWPVTMAPEADLLSLPANVPLDVFYGLWLPIASRLPVAGAWAVMLVPLAVVAVVPWLTRPKSTDAPQPSWVNPRFCTGCEQCYHDCPWEAIDMVRRDDGREGFVARVDPSKCVSCGICAGSCAPMGVGPPGRTGRDQLERVRAFIAEERPSHGDVIVVGCERSAAGWGADRVAGARVYPVTCAGALHTSVIEYLVRAGAGGVLVVSCPPRDCWNREGVAWLEARVHDRREAELQERVDRRRVQVAYAAGHEMVTLAVEVERFRAEVRALEGAEPEEHVEIAAVCETPEVSVAEEARS